jgi:predicted phage gp36 major capsid-like protein
MLPIAGGVILVMMIVFAMYVRSVPPPKPPTITVSQQSQAPDLGQSSINDDPMLQEALREAEEALKKMKAAEEEVEEASQAASAGESSETIEL